MDTPLILVHLLLLCLPVALYCLVLAQINHRLRPLVVSGQWDFAGLLFALSGFFLVVVPGILSHFASRSLLEVTLDANDSSWQEMMAQMWSRWWVWWLLYYGVLIGGIVWLWWRQRHKLVIYNVDPALLTSVLASVTAKLGLSQHDAGAAMVLEPAPPTEDASSAITPPPGKAALAIDSFPALCHVTLHWGSYNRTLRQAVEEKLRKELAESDAPDNPAALWLLCISSCLFGLMFVVVVILFLATYYPPRRF